MNLKDELTVLKGIGPVKAEAFAKIGIKSLEDLIFTFPVRYEDRRNAVAVNRLVPGEPAVFRGMVVRTSKGPYRGKRGSLLKVTVSDGTGAVEIVFFKGGYLDKTFVRGRCFDFFGTPVSGKTGIQVIHPEFAVQGELMTGIVPVYHVSGALTQKDMRNSQKAVREFYKDASDSVTPEIEERYNLCSLEHELEGLHFPSSRRHYGEARYRAVFDEVLVLQTGLLLARTCSGNGEKGVALAKGRHEIEYTDKLPYTLTKAQKRCIDEICRDLEKESSISRLVQGDVGSGKTVVAEAAIYKTVACGYQAVLMAPTEILARQHFEGFKRNFGEFGIKVGFLSGSVKKSERTEILEELKNGEIQILIGTHALIQPDVEFCRLGLVVTDEQHRFGVSQRIKLKEKGENPNLLLMTATPIPRTLAVIFYGEFEVSVIDELPPGRIKVATKCVRGRRDECYSFVKNIIDRGQQAYVVTPLIDESDGLDVRSAGEVYSELKEKFPSVTIDIVHGGMKQAEKDAAMECFARGETDILVATVVIEVGINVPNATVMVIENAERFGLAQLHQLRGRVGRGSNKSYCFLITESESETALKRCETIERTNDGFYIAEEDLRLRGPGEIFGTSQHGLPDMHITAMTKHTDILEKAKNEALNILNEDPQLSEIRHAVIKSRVAELFGTDFKLNL